MWNRRDLGTSEMNHYIHTKARSSSKEGDIVIRWWDWKGVVYYKLLLENQMIKSNKYCPQLDQVRAALDEEYLELFNRQLIIFHQDNRISTCFFDDQAKTVTAWLGSSDSSTVFARHCTFRFPFFVFSKFY